MRRAEYARRFHPAAVIDIATLPGRAWWRFGICTPASWATTISYPELVAAGTCAEDRRWQLPLSEEYAEALKSNFADFANVGGRDGGAIIAAARPAKFTQGLKWRTDVAGTAYQSGAQKGSTGRLTPLLADFHPARDTLSRYGASHARSLRHVRLPTARRAARLSAHLLRVRQARPRRRRISARCRGRAALPL